MINNKTLFASDYCHIYKIKFIGRKLNSIGSHFELKDVIFSDRYLDENSVEKLLYNKYQDIRNLEVNYERFSYE